MPSQGGGRTAFTSSSPPHYRLARPRLATTNKTTKEAGTGLSPQGGAGLLVPSMPTPARSALCSRLAWERPGCPSLRVLGWLHKRGQRLKDAPIIDAHEHAYRITNA